MNFFPQAVAKSALPPPSFGHSAQSASTKFAENTISLLVSPNSEDVCKLWKKPTDSRYAAYHPVAWQITQAVLIRGPNPQLQINCPEGQMRIAEEFRTSGYYLSVTMNGVRWEIPGTIKELQTRLKNLQGAVGILQADLQNAHWPEVILCEANLEWVDLQQSHLQRMNLQRARLKQVDLSRSDLQAAHLEEMHGQELDLYSTDLREAYMNHVFIEDSCMVNVDLRGANLQNACLKNVELYSAKFDETTLLDDAVISLKLPSGQGWKEDQSDLLLNHLNHPESGSLLTMIGSISNKYVDLKISLIHQIIDSLEGVDTSSLNEALTSILGREQAYMSDAKIRKFVFEKTGTSPLTAMELDPPQTTVMELDAIPTPVQPIPLMLPLHIAAQNLFEIASQTCDASNSPETLRQLWMMPAGTAQLTYRSIAWQITQPLLTTEGNPQIQIDTPEGTMLIAEGNQNGSPFLIISVSATRAENYIEEITIQTLPKKGITIQNLQEALRVLQELDLHGANLERACLYEAELEYVNLQNANLKEANLQRVNLKGGNLDGACLDNANLDGANLKEVSMKNVALTGTNFNGATLSDKAEIELYLPPWDQKTLDEHLNHLKPPFRSLLTMIQSISDSYPELKINLTCQIVDSLKDIDTSGIKPALRDFFSSDLRYMNCEKTLAFILERLRAPEIATVCLPAQSLARVASLLTSARTEELCELWMRRMDEARLPCRPIAFEIASKKPSKGINPQIQIDTVDGQITITESIKDGISPCLTLTRNNESVEIPGTLNELRVRLINLKGANLRKAGLHLANLSKANLQDANLSLAHLKEAYLFKANLQDANLSRANLYGAILVGADLRGTNLQKAILKKVNLLCAKFNDTTQLDETSIELFFPRWSQKTLIFYYNHLHHPEDGSLLTTINSINNKYKDLKLNLMHQVIDSLKDVDTSVVNDAFIDIFMNNPLYANDAKIGKFMRDKVLAFPITAAINSWITFSESQLTFLLGMVKTIGTEEGQQEDQQKTAQEKFMLEHNSFFMQLMISAVTNRKAAIKATAAQLYDAYLSLAPLKVYRDEFLPNIDGTTQGIKNITIDSLAFVFVRQNADTKTYDALLASWNEIRTMKNRPANHDWDNIHFFSNEKFVMRPDLKTVFSAFPLFQAPYLYVLNGNGAKFVNLLQVINLKAAGTNNVPGVPATDYTPLFTEVLERSVSTKKLTSNADQLNLEEIFSRLLTAEPYDELKDGVIRDTKRITPEHYEQIVTVFSLPVATLSTGLSPEQKLHHARVLFCLSAVFAKYSSSHIFGESKDSPNILRTYAAALMIKAWETEPSVFGETSELSKENFTNWLTRMVAGRQNGKKAEFECTAVVAGIMVEHARKKEEFIVILSGIKPPAW